MKCGLCGLTYVGVAANRPNGKREFYYRCNGAHSPSVYSATGRCGSKAVRGDCLEDQVWSDVQMFLRNPGQVLQQLHARLETDARDSDQIRKQVSHLEGRVSQKATERSRVVGLYRRGRLSEAELDAQMDQIGDEESALNAQLLQLRGRISGTDSIKATINSAEALLARLRKRLDEPISWELKRRLVEVLVAGVRVDTVEEGGVRQNAITVTYRFSQPDGPMALTLAQSYSAGGVVRIPREPSTIGDHIRRTRLALGLLQRDVARQIGVDETSVSNWESNGRAPGIRHLPAIIQFLGYNPLPSARDWSGRLVRARTSLGLSQKEAARFLHVDPGTLARWERGDRTTAPDQVARTERLLVLTDDAGMQERRAG